MTGHLETLVVARERVPAAGSHRPQTMGAGVGNRVLLAAAPCCSDRS